ncbi:MAG: chemotaxis response regulator protein-glutamate methylesterase [Acetobacteraceae bacterium]
MLATVPPRPTAIGQTEIRVLVCDDSAVMRAAIARALEGDPGVRVVARAANGALAIEALQRQPVDVVVLDIEMPVMDGLTALPLLLRAAPGVRVVMASTLTTRGADVTLRALRLGAADYVAKPSAIGGAQSAEAFRRDLLGKVKALGLRRFAPEPAVAGSTPDGRELPPFRPRPLTQPHLLAIGSSTGGPQALFTLMAALGDTMPVPVVLTQHMPAAFTPILAEHMTRAGRLPCAEARDGEALLPGRVYLAPGDRHLLIDGGGGGATARLSNEPAINFCRPSVDPMLESAAASFGGRVLVVILTGMGHDGLAGTRRVVAAGGAVIAQDEASSIVWGMPGAVARAGLCHAVLPLAEIAPRLLDLLRVARK